MAADGERPILPPSLNLKETDFISLTSGNASSLPVGSPYSTDLGHELPPEIAHEDVQDSGDASLQIAQDEDIQDTKVGSTHIAQDMLTPRAAEDELVDETVAQDQQPIRAGVIKEVDVYHVEQKWVYISILVLLLAIIIGLILNNANNIKIMGNQLKVIEKWKSNQESCIARLEEMINGSTNRLDILEADHTGQIADTSFIKSDHARLDKEFGDLKSRLDTTGSKLTSLMREMGDIPINFLVREDGSVNFTRSWSEYRDGFEDPDGEFWLGLTSLHRMTRGRRYGLRVDLVAWSGETKWAEYGHFAVGPESDKFRLSISGYVKSSTASDGMTDVTDSLNGMAFTTYDSDNDLGKGNCAFLRKGGWWYSDCGLVNPTGLYKPAGYRGLEGLSWYTNYNKLNSFKAVSLRLVPV